MNTSKVHGFPLISAALVASIVLASVALPGADGTWANLNGGSWTNQANWTGSTIADGIGATANFSTLNITDNRTVTLDGDRTVGRLLFGDASSGQQDWILAPGSGGVLTLASASDMPRMEMPLTRNNNDFIVQLDVDIAGTQGIMFVGDNDNVGGRFRFRAVPKSYGGDTIVTNGAKLQLENDFGDGGAVPDGPGKGDLYLWNGTVGQSRFIINQVNETVNGLWGNGQVDKDNAVRTVIFSVGNNDASSTFSGTLSDMGNAPFTLRKIGAGTFTFEGSAGGTFTGTFLADGGTLLFGSSALIPMGCTLAAGAGTLDVSAVTYWPEPLNLAGAGSISGAVTVSGGTVSPGFSIGTLTLNNGLTYSGFLASPTNIFELGSATTEGAGINDLLVVNGNIDLGFQSIQVVFKFTDPTALPATDGYYTLVRYTGSLLNQGAFVAAGLPPFINATFDTSVPGEVRVSFTYTLSQQNLVWSGDGSLNYWDMWNWSWNGGSAVFAGGDTVTFDDSGSTNPPVDLREPLLPAAVTVNASKDYVFGGLGYLYGSMNLTKSGSGTLVLTSNANAYAGTTLVDGGILRVLNASALGLTNGGTLVASGATLDLNANVGLEPLTVSGHGVNVGGTNLGAITRTVAGGDDLAANVTLAGDTTFSAPVDRWDIQTFADDQPGLRGNGFKLTKVGAFDLMINGGGDPAVYPNTNIWDTGLGDIEVVQGVLSFERRITLGQPDKSVIVHSNAILRLYATAVTNHLGEANVIVKNLYMTNGIFQLNGDTGAWDAPTIFGGPLEVHGECLLNSGNARGALITSVISGPGAVRKLGGQQLTLAAANTFTGPLIVTQNRLVLGNPAGQCVASTGIFLDASNNLARIDLAASEQINDNAVITMANAVAEDCRLSLKGYNETIAGLQGNRGSGTYQVYVQAGAGGDGDSNLLSTLTLNVPAGASHDFGGNLRDFGGTAPGCVLTLVKDGPGTQIFSGQANYSGTTTIRDGTLVISGADSVLANSPVVLAGGTLEISNSGTGTRSNVNITGTGDFVKDGAGTVVLAMDTLNTATGSTEVQAGVLRVDGTLGSGSGTITVAGGTLAGGGTINDPVTVQANGELSPGVSAGFLNITKSLTLQGTTTMEISKLGPTILLYDQVYGMTQVNYGGNLVISDLGATPAYAAGDTFSLFLASHYQGAFANVTLPSLSAGLRWNTSELNTAGRLRIEAEITVPTTPTNMTFSVSSGQLTLEWPANYTGWTLQSQTNTAGIQPNPAAWYPVPGSQTTNLWTIPIDPANPPVFYRLFYPVGP